MSKSEASSSPTGMRTVIVTGGAGDIGGATIRAFHAQGYNVVIADLPYSESTAESIILSLSDSSRALYVPTDITNWNDMQHLFRETKDKFGRVDVVVANAGLMESKGFFDFTDEENDKGELKEPSEAWKVVDVNLKGSMNTLRLSMHSMQANPIDANGARGSIVLVASTSGYFGGTGVVSYVASKHGVVGLARASQLAARKKSIRVNVVAPSLTPTFITAGFAKQWKERGLPANTVEDVANAIADVSADPERNGHSVMVAGSVLKEIETKRATMTEEWLGEDICKMMAESGKFFDDIGGYTLPEVRS